MPLGGYSRGFECQLEQCWGTSYFSRIAATGPACMLFLKCDFGSPPTEWHPFLLSLDKTASTPRVWQKGHHVNSKARS